MEKLQCRIEVPTGSCLDLDDVQFKDGIVYTFQSPGRAGLFLRGTIHSLGPDEPAVFYLGERVPISELDSATRPRRVESVEPSASRLRFLGWSSTSSTSRVAWERWAAVILAMALLVVATRGLGPSEETFASKAISKQEYWSVRRQGDLTTLASLWNVSPGSLAGLDGLHEAFLQRPRSERKEALQTLGRLVSRRLLDIDVASAFFERLIRSRDIEPAALRQAVIFFKSCAPASPERASVLVPLLWHWHPVIRQETAIALGSLKDEDALPHLLARLTSETHPEALRDLVYGIGMYLNPHHESLLTSIADHPHPSVRKAVQTVQKRYRQNAPTKAVRESPVMSRAFDDTSSENGTADDRFREMR